MKINMKQQNIKGQRKFNHSLKSKYQQRNLPFARCLYLWRTLIFHFGSLMSNLVAFGSFLVEVGFRQWSFRINKVVILSSTRESHVLLPACTSCACWEHILVAWVEFLVAFSSFLVAVGFRQWSFRISKVVIWVVIVKFAFC